jgi:hypothetical protein
MANSYIGLTDLVKLNDLNARDNGITDLLNDSPVLRAIYATTASNGTKHNYLKQTGAPTVGFRSPNAGKSNSNSSYTEITLNLALIDASFVIDQAIAASYRYGEEAFIERESRSQLRQALFQFEQQMWYGQVAGAAAGFVGFADNANYNAAAGSLVVNAAGTTAATASSVWLIRSVPDEQGVTAIIGNQGEIAIGETVSTLKPDDTDATKFFPAWMTPISGYIGVQIGGNYSAVRIGNVTGDAGKGLTDALISKAIALFPVGKGPTHICCSRRSLQQLQASRTATSPSGAPAPIPQDSFNIPIVVTDSILNTEALLT